MNDATSAAPSPEETLAGTAGSVFPLADLLERFRTWQDEARRAGEKDPTAMSLATVTPDGGPAVRIVLLKHADERGFVFYTNLESDKAADLRAHPRAALAFHWASLGRQVRLAGRVEAVSADEADAYFATRPRLSQIGAWVSRQSRPMPTPLALEQACAAYALRHPFAAIPRPPFWSGFRVLPERIEFWQERPFRRHDRRLYLPGDGGWREQRLYP